MREADLNVPAEYRSKRRPRFGARPEIMRRVEQLFATQDVSQEEFRKWWEQAESKIAPLAGTPKEGQYPDIWAGGTVSASDLPVVREYLEYLLKAVPRPGKSEKVALGDMSEFVCSARYTSLDPGARINGITSIGKCSALGGLPASGWLAYRSEPVGGLLMFEWEPHEDEYRVFTQIYIRR